MSAVILSDIRCSETLNESRVVLGATVSIIQKYWTRPFTKESIAQCHRACTDRERDESETSMYGYNAVSSLVCITNSSHFHVKNETKKRKGRASKGFA